jgi:alkylation response protein AidB-like acyl-CoA dehydrogenase
MTPESLEELLYEPDELRTWRQTVREFVQKHLPAELERRVALGLKLDKEHYVRWQQILYRHNWFAGSWPVEHGGQGWDLPKQLIFNQESAVCNAPMVIPYGVNMVGPVLYTYGDQAQRRRHLPGILSSEVWWCQGYSEPGAGSDLASLKTAAVRDGDDYVVNGTKMWTTEAHWADWMHCLVRTGRSGKPQEGISFLLIDMRTPGITVTPIVTIDGVHHTNQVFLDNVRVPAGNRVGEEGQGWAIAKFLLGNERTSIADTGPKLRFLRHLQSLYAARTEADSLPEQRATWHTRLADLEIQLLTLCALERRYVEGWANGQKLGAEASILKIRGTEILQAMTELAMDLEGPLATAHDPADLHREGRDSLSPPERASVIAHEYLYSRCWSIFGGTNEVQRNLIARQILSSQP